MTLEQRQLGYAAKLRQLRVDAGYEHGKDFAARLGWIASKVSRIENGRTVPSDQDVKAWAAAAGAVDQIEALQNELIALRLERDRWKRQLRGGHAPAQQATAAKEHDATTIIMLELFLVPGLLQTDAYARRVFELAAAMHHTPADTDAAVRERIRRQAALYDPTKNITILMSEFALQNPICDAVTLRAQVDRIYVLAGLSHVRLGVIPLGAALPTITMNGFTILDDTVVVEVNHTEITITDVDDVQLHRDIAERLWSVVATGDEARKLLRRSLDSLPEQR